MKIYHSSIIDLVLIMSSGMRVYIGFQTKSKIRANINSKGIFENPNRPHEYYIKFIKDPIGNIDNEL